MEFLRNVFRSGSKNAGNGGPLAEGSKYASWTKEQLTKRVLELEAGNVGESSVTEQKRKLPDPGSPQRPKRTKTFDFSKYDTRFIALKFAYLGWNYNGLAIQKGPTPLPTVEGTLLKAMNKCKLIPSMDPQDFQFSRCGRTDKGVSAMSQVISLKVRSNLTTAEQQDSANDAREIPYIKVLNQNLPSDIRVYAVCLRPPEGFDARFSCIHRHYKYFFHKKGLNVEKMKKAACFYEGENDFRNFCKIDGSKQITNYKRKIKSATIIKVSDDFYCFDLIGSAFLWHQVRCMMAVLFLVGQELEDPTLVREMLDVQMTPQKPIYDMASDIPLILYNCEFPAMEWTDLAADSYAADKFSNEADALELEYHLKSTVASIFQKQLPQPSSVPRNRTRINLGDAVGKVISVYQKMMDRQVMESFDIVNKKFKERKKRSKASRK